MIKADPPALMNGSGIPFVGSIPETTNKLIITCRLKTEVHPRARYLPNSSCACQAIQKPLQMKIPKSATSAQTQK